MAEDLGARILVLEDQPETQTLLSKQLTSVGYQVTIAPDGLAGLMQLERFKPDLIIIDILMPKLDGLEFAKAIRAKEATRNIPTLFLTAKDDPRSMVEGINAGARFYITKPFDMNDLIGKIRRVLRQPAR